MKIIIGGTRTFDDYDMLKETLDFFLDGIEEDIEIVSGGARGADSLGERYAKEREFALHRKPANWDLHGKAAGYIRNEEMAKYVGVKGMCIVFWDGASKGTKHMIDLARKHGVDTRIIEYQ
jgi:hypothetical protein